MRIEPPQRWELIFGVGIWLFVSIAILISAGPMPDIRSKEVLGSGLFASVALLFIYAELLRRSRLVEIDLEEGVVKISRRRWSWIKFYESYSLNRFGRVRSIVTNISKHNSVHVCLIERETGRALTLALFSPISGVKSFFDIPADEEPLAAAELRGSVARLTGLIDSGFEGSVFPPPSAKADGRR